MTNETGAAIKPDSQDIQDNKLMAVLSYLGILVLVPLLAAKESPFARFHANQGLILLILAFASFFVTFIISTVVTFVLGNVPVLGPVFGFLLGGLLYFAVWIFLIVLMVAGIMNAAKGKEKPLPLIGNYKVLKNV